VEIYADNMLCTSLRFIVELSILEAMERLETVAVSDANHSSSLHFAPLLLTGSRGPGSTAYK
jgi:hypothetical protein